MVCIKNAINEQINIFGDSADYSAFLDKFKGKKTTDDCYTPPLVYDAVADFVVSEYGRDRADFVRPFYPGGDFETFPYRDGAVVVDNPPFSIITQICKTYNAYGVKYFLFAPYLTNFSSGRLTDQTHIIAGVIALAVIISLILLIHGLVLNAELHADGTI